jgi:hypothetical protein
MTPEDHGQALRGTPAEPCGPDCHWCAMLAESIRVVAMENALREIAKRPFSGGTTPSQKARAALDDR